ncbi:MAG: FAD-binding protein [Chloroflexi bacterium AL-W]|nr:FAD-binding protein [Chloroflexi bacterium AL-N1]NOK65219.1 FAD-binding protein [Chloroflexi bacterium AL-N10]NOK72516.1 FAD-binding protein [Chloroflexi bacterium AL-N5]NOK79398.1 FAD-binding protein [Chloroflexi bacterium AL-W]NOK87314.1 FAD-binding protein [Chloroflexi bacterium AL-N15]
MAKTIVIGDGPGGLSAALLLAKKGVEVAVFGKNETAMHYAMLYNYLGIPAMTGTEFQEVARKQVQEVGATLYDQQVTQIAQINGGFTVTAEDGSSYEGTYVIIAEGKAAKLANTLGVDKTDAGITVDNHARTNIPGLYVVGRSTKPNRSQAIISAGEGASAALDILSTEAGQEVCDYDMVEKS